MSDIGNQLRAARESKGLTIADVEKVTRIRARFLEAMEDGRWDALPGPVQIRGFLKNYAVFLGLNGDELVAAREQAFSSTSRRPRVFTARMLGSPATSA